MVASRVRSWSDGLQIGGVRIEIRAAGNLLGWSVRGPLDELSGGQRVELAYTLWLLVERRAGSVWDVYDSYFAAGRRTHGTRSGVRYVNPHE